MDSRTRRPVSPERQRPTAGELRKVPVVYYLSRNRHLEHPHFIEVPLSSPDGLFLRDVINRLNAVRGKGMAAMYSWSCKRSYKNGFVWHDLAEDDLILPAAGSEYVLKGSELLDQSPSDQIHNCNGNQRQQNSRLPSRREAPKLSRRREASCSSPPPTVVVREAKPRPSLSPSSSREEEESPLPYRSGSSENISPVTGPQRIPLSEIGFPSPAGAVDAATQTEDVGRRPFRQSPEIHNQATCAGNGSVIREFSEYQKSYPRRSTEWREDVREMILQCPTPSNVSLSRGKSESLESLIKAEASKTNNFRVLEEEEVVVPTCPKLRPTNVLMQLITCGSISVNDHENLALVSTYRPRFPNLKFSSPVSRTMMVGELDYLSGNPRLMGLRLEDKEYFSGSIVETQMHREVAGERMPMLKRSSSYNAERGCKSLDSGGHEEDTVNTSSRSWCLPRTAKLTSLLLPKTDMLRSPMSDRRRSSSAGPDCSLPSREGSKRFADASSVQGSSMRLDSFRKEKEKLIKIEERLLSGARVTIQSSVPCDDSDEGSDTDEV